MNEQVQIVNIPLLEPSELRARMDALELTWILDLRNPQDVEQCRIEGDMIRSIAIPYFLFLDELDVEAALTQLPKDVELLLVCNKGKSARMVAEVLQSRALNVRVLDGGMQGWLSPACD